MTDLRDVRREAYSALLYTVTGKSDDGTLETPERAAKAFEDLTSGYLVDVPGLFKTFESGEYQGVVRVEAIQFYSLCEHHLLPFFGEATIAYRPNGKIVGLSKLARLVQAYARRLQVQERMTHQIAAALLENLHPRAVDVTVRAEHLCMAARGIEARGTITETHSSFGAMVDPPPRYEYDKPSGRYTGP